MDQQKTFVVPAFLLAEAESAERADEIACAVTETLNNLPPHGHGYASLRLDECMATLEAPADFPGESLLQLGDDVPPYDYEIRSAMCRILAGLELAQPATGYGLDLEIELAQDVIAKLEGSAA